MLRTFFDIVKTTVAALPIGLYTTIKHLFRKPVTKKYPRVKSRWRRGTGDCIIWNGTTTAANDVSAADCARPHVLRMPFIWNRRRMNEASDTRRYMRSIFIRCIFCGFCEEACPEEAIFLGHEFELADDHRDKFIRPRRRCWSSIPVRPPV